MQLMNETDWNSFWIKSQNNIYIRATWQVIRKLRNKTIRKLFSGITQVDNVNILELGSADGNMALFLLKYFNAKYATIVDNCSYIARKISRKPEGVKFVFKNIFELDINNEYDVVCSDGLIEHFVDNLREKLLYIHINASKTGGYILIFCPIDNNLYRIQMYFAKLFRLMVWKQVPINKNDLIEYFKKRNCELINYIEIGFYPVAGFLFRKISN